MALAILDGTQTATTLSTILSSGQHITAHTVVSLGTQAITDMRSAVSGSVVSISNFPASQAISGTVTANLDSSSFVNAVIANNANGDPFNISGTVTVGNTVTIGAGTVTIGAGTAQIGSVTASISNSVTIASLPAISGTVTANVFGLGQITELPSLIPVMHFGDPIGDSTIGNIVPIQITNQNGTVDGNNPLPISGTVTANTFALQGTAVTTSNFTSTTASTVLANYNATREVLTIFSEGPGTLFVSAGATCTTVQYQVRLSSGDYYEAPSHQSTITHSAVFATAGTARVTEIT